MIENRSGQWTVFADHSIAREEPRLDAPVVTRYAKGDVIEGVTTDREFEAEWIVTDSDGEPAYSPRWEVHRVHPDNLAEKDLPVGGEIVTRWWGLRHDYEPSDLVRVPAEKSYYPERELLLRQEACDALVKLMDAAKGDSVPLLVVSAYRSSAYQLDLYRKGMERSGPSQRFSAPPGHSEHQLGTCVDVADAEGAEVITQSFANTPQCKWLGENAARFGFFRTYTDENTGETGYISEPWHWRYKGT